MMPTVAAAPTATVLAVIWPGPLLLRVDLRGLAAAAVELSGAAAVLPERLVEAPVDLARPRVFVAPLAGDLVSAELSSGFAPVARRRVPVVRFGVVDDAAAARVDLEVREALRVDDAGLVAASAAALVSPRAEDVEDSGDDASDSPAASDADGGEVAFLVRVARGDLLAISALRHCCCSNLWGRMRFRNDRLRRNSFDQHRAYQKRVRIVTRLRANYQTEVSERAEYPDPGKRWLIIITVMAATLMQILDTTIANVALPHMQAALGATPETVVWVLTSYIVMAAIATPITGWLETRFGRRRLFMIAIIGFTVSSALCGMAVSLEMMVAARAMQGIFGAFIAPLGQAVMLDSSPPDKQPQSMMIWGMGVMIAPILGPVLGGWLTDTYGWRWVFYINLPIGIVATVGIWLLLDEVRPEQRRFDLLGFGLLALALGSFQIMLDRGAQLDWFDSTEIIIEAGLAAGAFWMFVVHSLSSSSPLLPPALFRDRNFVLATMFTMLVAGVVMSGAALVAPMLQHLMGYEAMGAGFLTMPRGIGALIAMPLAARFIGKIDARIMIMAGLSLTAGSLWMMTGFDLEMSGRQVVISAVVQGLGIGFAFMPLNILAFGTLAARLRTEGAALYNLARNIGGSISISLMGALLARNVQVSHADLGAHVTSVSMPVLESGFLERLGIRGTMIASFIDAEINRQALMIAYLDDFWVMMWASLLVLPLVFFLRRPSGGAVPPVHME